MENLADAIENGTRDQHSDALVSDSIKINPYNEFPQTNTTFFYSITINDDAFCVHSSSSSPSSSKGYRIEQPI